MEKFIIRLENITILERLLPILLMLSASWISFVSLSETDISAKTNDSYWSLMFLLLAISQVSFLIIGNYTMRKIMLVVVGLFLMFWSLKFLIMDWKDSDFIALISISIACFVSSAEVKPK